MNAIELFLRDHARAHSSAMAPAEGNISFEDVIFGGLTDEQLRMRPHERVNSLAWLLWHMARSEDVGVNVFVAGRKQMLEEDDWLPRLGLSRRDIGTGMTDDEVAEFSGRVDIAALRAYRAAVGRRTREIVSAMRPAELAELVDPADVRRAFEEGVISESARWLEGFVGGKTKAFVLGHTGTGHNFLHLGEAMCVRSLGGFGLRV